MELLEVVDSAIKIGLGALISGVATFIAAKTNKQAVLSKEIAMKKIAMLDDAAELVEPYFRFNNQLVFKTLELTIEHSNGGKELNELQMAALKEVLVDQAQVANSRNRARSKIQLLQLKEAEEALRAYTSSVIEHRTLIQGKKIAPTTEQSFEIQTKLHEQEDRFYRALSEGLNSVGRV